jgi:hypothetical protein
MNKCNNFLNTLLIIYLFCFLIFLTLQFINNPIEGFLDLGIMKKCNKIKRQCKARMTILKNGAERKVNTNLQKAYDNVKTISKKIIFPKEIKISF